MPAVNDNCGKLNKLRPDLSSAGFDIAHPFDAHAAGFDGPRLGILVGNTKALWPRFVEAMQDAELSRESDPLDRYTELAIGRVFPTARIFYGHRQYDGAYIPLQHIAVATGLGVLAESHLVIHPVYGPWFALRAVVLLDGDPPARLPIAKPCACSDACPRALDAALANASDWRAWLGVRDACSLRDWRYSDEQIAFHYTKVWRGA